MIVLWPRTADRDRDHVSYNSCPECSDGTKERLAKRRLSNRFVLTSASCLSNLGWCMSVRFDDVAFVSDQYCSRCHVVELVEMTI